jgi:hypothetical protein
MKNFQYLLQIILIVLVIILFILTILNYYWISEKNEPFNNPTTNNSLSDFITYLFGSSTNNINQVPNNTNQESEKIIKTGDINLSNIHSQNDIQVHETDYTNLLNMKNITNITQSETYLNNMSESELESESEAEYYPMSSTGNIINKYNQEIQTKQAENIYSINNNNIKQFYKKNEDILLPSSVDPYIGRDRVAYKDLYTDQNFVTSRPGSLACQVDLTPNWANKNYNGTFTNIISTCAYTLKDSSNDPTIWTRTQCMNACQKITDLS